LASPTAIAFPMPRLPPVTRATLPDREKTLGEIVIVHLLNKIHQL
jgi:hypothetical protein